MLHDNVSSEGRFLNKKARVYLVVGILFLAVVLRMIYGYDLIKHTVDETDRLKLIQSLSVQKDKMNLPMGSATFHHPVLVTYFTAGIYWLTGGSIYSVRIIFVLLSTFGLTGLFFLTRELFGYRIGILALFLGATDHYLISYAPEFLENVYLCLVPWLIFAVYRAVELDKSNYWIVIGIIGGLGYMCFELFALLTIPITIIIFSSGKTAKVIKTPQLYIGLALSFLIILPNLLWNYNHFFINYNRHIEKATPIGFVPRMALLYLGDLLINLKKSSEIILGMGNTIYGPCFIPCHWVSGLLYLFSAGYCLKEITKRRHAILFFFFFSIIIPISMINTREPWNEFEWGAMSIFPVLCLTAWTADQFIKHKLDCVIYVILLLVIPAYTVSFLAGPKCGYASPFWEKSFVGDFIYYMGMKKDPQMASKLVEAAIEKHPESAIAHYFRSELASDPEQIESSLQKVWELEPFNPLACEAIAEELIEKNKNAEAYRLLSETVHRGNNFWQIQQLLGKAAYNLADYSGAEGHFKQAIEIKPDAFDVYWGVFYAVVSQEKFAEGLSVLDKLAAHTDSPDKIYLAGAQILLRLGNRTNAEALYKKALRINPDLPATPQWEPIQ